MGQGLAGKHSERIRQWLLSQALPLWATVGVDPAGGFVESLKLDGTPDYAVAKRLRVQARQIYVYSHAALLGLWPDGIEIARRGFDFVMERAWLGGASGGFARLLDRGGAIEDGRLDTYDHAFVLLSFSWLYRAAKDRDVERALEQTIASIDHHLKDPNGMGYLEPSRRGEARWQNPHMHLLEAFIAAYHATGEQGFLDRASNVVELFQRHLFDRSIGVMREYFTEDWERPAPGEAGLIAEAGHHCEWVWLLNEYAKAKGTAPSPSIHALHSFAMKHGREPQSGLLYHENFVDGRVKTNSKRCWAQTEALKAEIALGGIAGIQDATRADAVVDGIFRYFLDQEIRGGWGDVVGSDNRPIATTIPASTFYHVFLAFTEYLRVYD